MEEVCAGYKGSSAGVYVCGEKAYKHSLCKKCLHERRDILTIEIKKLKASQTLKGLEQELLLNKQAELVDLV